MTVKYSTSNNYIFIQQFASFILACLIFIRCQPYYFWESENNLRLIISILIGLISFPFINTSRKSLTVLSLFAISFILAGILRQSDFLRIMNLLLLGIIPILNKRFIMSSLKWFKMVFSIVLLLSLLNLLIVALGISGEPNIIQPINELKSYNYLQYPFLLVPNDTGFLDYFRFSAVFDEPGVVGTFCGLALCTDKFNLKSWENIILFIAGLLSFSFYFYLIFVIVIVYNLNTKNRWLIIFLIVIFYLSTFSNDFFDYHLWRRLSWDEERNTLIGNNRSSIELMNQYKEALFTQKFFFGFGYDYMKRFMGDASIYLVILREGFIFVALNILAYLTLAYYNLKNAKKELILFTIILLSTLYQRPGFFEYPYIFLFISIIFSFSKLKKKQIDEFSLTTISH